MKILRYCLGIAIFHAISMYILSTIHLASLSRVTSVSRDLSVPAATDIPNYLSLDDYAGEDSTSYSSGLHDPVQQRNCLAFTATPYEIEQLARVVNKMLDLYTSNTMHCIHLSIPRKPFRFKKQEYPSDAELRRMFSNPRVIIHRLSDFGPLTRYLGPLLYEKNPDTRIVVFDMDSRNILANRRNLTPLVMASRDINADAAWCFDGEDFRFNERTGGYSPHWNTYPVEQKNGYTWNQAFFCRGAAGFLVKPKFFQNFWYNQSSYHPSCFFDDDRWIGFQFEKHRIKMLSLHETESHPRRRLGSLTYVNSALGSKENCTKAWMQRHPEAFPLARV